MTGPVLVQFAVPFEAAPFLRKIEGRESVRAGIGQAARGAVRGTAIVAFAGGTGATAAGRSLASAVEAFRPAGVILAGFGGGLDAALRVGDVVVDAARWPGLVIPADCRVGTIACVAGVAASAWEKVALRERTGAAACDMESAGMAPVVERAKLPFAHVRAVSDTALDDLPSGALAAAWDMERQRSTPARLAWRLAARPGEAAAFLRFVGGLGRARERLGAALAALLGAGGGLGHQQQMAPP